MEDCAAHSGETIGVEKLSKAQSSDDDVDALDSFNDNNVDKHSDLTAEGIFSISKYIKRTLTSDLLTPQLHFFLSQREANLFV